MLFVILYGLPRYLNQVPFSLPKALSFVDSIPCYQSVACTFLYPAHTTFGTSLYLVALTTPSAVGSKVYRGDHQISTSKANSL